MSEKIDVVLPQKYDLVVGDTFQLFYRGVILAPNPYNYHIVAVCEKGKHFPRYFEFTPDVEGKFELEISVYDAERNLLGEGKTILNVIRHKKASKPLNILCMGASLVTHGEWVSECHRRLTATGGEPEGLGFDNISFIGKCKRGDVGYEGYGGWAWDTYSSNSFGGIWVVCDHDKTNEDQHSLWSDVNGNIWKLETIEKGWLKFVRYNHKEPMELTGSLAHLSNAIHQSEVAKDRVVPEKESPFCDHETKAIDFIKYLKVIEAEKIDAVYILLGYNGITDVSNPKEKMCPEVVKKAKVFVDILHSQLPEVKVKIMGQALPSLSGGTGANYGAVLPYADTFGLVRYVMELNVQYEAWTKEEKYCEFMDFINVSGQFDAENNYPAEEKPVNIRSKKTEFVGTNGVHPNYDGYMQIADAAYRNMVHFCAEN